MQAFYSPTQVLEFLRAIYGADAALRLDSYSYGVTFSGVAAGATSSAVLNVNGNADFLVLALSHRANVAAAGQTVSTKIAPLARLLVTEQSNGNQWWSTALDLETVSENGPTPKTLQWPRLVPGKSSLTLALSNYDASQTYGVDLVLHGVNVYQFTG